MGDVEGPCFSVTGPEVLRNIEKKNNLNNSFYFPQRLSSHESYVGNIRHLMTDNSTT